MLLWTGGTLHGAGQNTTDDRFRKGIITGYTLGWLRTEHRFWVYKPLREGIDRLSPTLQDLLGYSETTESLGYGFTLQKPDENWDRSEGNHPYLMRSPSQAAAKESQTEQETGARWFDEPFYSSPLWRPETPNPAKDGDYITRLRERRPWTMSPKVEKK